MSAGYHHHLHHDRDPHPHETCYEFSAAVCPIEGPPLGSGGYDPGGKRGGPGAFFNAGGHCCSDTKEGTNSEDWAKIHYCHTKKLK